MALNDDEDQGVPGSTPDDYVSEVPEGASALTTPLSPPKSLSTSVSPIPKINTTDYAAQPPAPNQSPIGENPRLARPVEPEYSSNPDDDNANIRMYEAHSRQVDAYNKRVQASAYEAKKKAINKSARADMQDTGRQYELNEQGVETPRIDPVTGQQAVKESKHPVQYDAKGRPFQVVYNEGDEAPQTVANPDGTKSTILSKKIKDPDADAEYGANPDDPNDPNLYRYTKLTPWQAVDPKEGIISSDNRLAIASAKHLHEQEMRAILSQRANLIIKIKKLKQDLPETEQDSGQEADGNTDAPTDPALTISITGLNAKARARHEDDKKTYSIPTPEPKAVMSGWSGVNQEATAKARAEWASVEADRTKKLADTNRLLDTDNQIQSAKKQILNLSEKHQALYDEGPAGYLKRQREEYRNSIANLPPEDAQVALSEGGKQIGQTDVDIQSSNADLAQRINDLTAKRQKGGTAADIAEWDKEAAGIQADSQALQTKIADRNIQADQLKTGTEEFNKNQQAKTQEQRDQMRKNPVIAPMADELDKLDQEATYRKAKLQSISDPAERQKAADLLDTDLQSKRDAISSSIQTAQKEDFDQKQKADSDLSEKARQRANLEKQIAEGMESSARFQALSQPGMAMVGVEDTNPEVEQAKSKLSEMDSQPDAAAIKDRQAQLKSDDEKLTFRDGKGYEVLHNGNVAINPASMRPEGLRPKGMPSWDDQIKQAQADGKLKPDQATAMTKRMALQAQGVQEQIIDKTLINDSFKGWLFKNDPELWSQVKDPSNNKAPDFIPQNPKQQEDLRAAALTFLKSEPSMMEKIGDVGSKFVYELVPSTIGSVATAAGVLTNAGGHSPNSVGNWLQDVGLGVEALKEQSMDPRLADFTAGNIAGHAGGLAGFLIPGAVVGKVAKAAGMSAEVASFLSQAATGAVGAAQNASAVYNEARQMGKSEKEAFLPFLLSGVVGAGVVIPVSHYLNTFAEPVKNALVKGLVKTATEAVAFTALNDATSLANNAIAKHFYDENRDLFAGIAESSESGAISGAILGMISAAVGGAKVARLKQKYNIPKDWTGSIEDLGRADSQIEGIHTQPTAKDLVKRRTQLLDQLSGAVGDAVPVIQRQVAMINAAIKADPLNIPAESRPDLASALLKISQGVKFQDLSETERSTLGKAKTSSGVPFIEDHEGATIITDTAKEWLGNAAPHAADLIGLTGQQAKDASKGTFSDEEQGNSQNQENDNPEQNKTRSWLQNAAAKRLQELKAKGNNDKIIGQNPDGSPIYEENAKSPLSRADQEEHDFLDANPTDEDIAKRYGYTIKEPIQGGVLKNKLNSDGSQTKPESKDTQDTSTSSAPRVDPAPLSDDAPMAQRKSRAGVMWSGAQEGDTFTSSDSFGENYTITIKKNRDGSRYGEILSPRGDLVDNIQIDKDPSSHTKGNGLIFGQEMVRVEKSELRNESSNAGSSNEDKSTGGDEDPPAAGSTPNPPPPPDNQGGGSVTKGSNPKKPLTPTTKRGTILSRILQAQGVDREVADHYAGLKEGAYADSLTNEALRDQVTADFEKDGGKFPKQVRVENTDADYWRSNFPEESPENHQRYADQAKANNEGRLQEANDQNRKLLDLRPEGEEMESPEGNLAAIEMDDIPDMPQVRPLTDLETKQAKALSVRLQKEAGASPGAADAFSRQHIRDGGKPADIIQSFNDAGGVAKQDAISDSIQTAEAMGGQDAQKLIEQADLENIKIEGKPLNPNQKQKLTRSIQQLAPEITRWNEAFGKISFPGEVSKSGGAQLSGMDHLKINLGDILHRKAGNYEVLINDPERAKLLISEEAIHAIGNKILSERSKLSGRSKESIIGSVGSFRGSLVSDSPSEKDHADAEAADLFRSLPKDLQDHVRGIYSKNPMANEDWELGHEFLRMLAQHDIAVDKGGRIIADGKVLTEQTLGQKIVDQIREHLAKLFSYLSKLSERMREGGSKEEDITSVEQIRAQIRESIKTLRTRVDESQLASYQEAYARKTSATRDARYARGMGQARQNGGALVRGTNDIGSDLGETLGSEGRSGLPGSGDRVPGGGSAPAELSDSGSREQEGDWNAVVPKSNINVRLRRPGPVELSEIQSSAGTELQPRNRQRASNKEQEAQMAYNWKPSLAKAGDFTDRGPIIFTRINGKMVNLSGHGRQNAQSLMYEQDGVSAKKNRAWIKQEMKRNGYSAEEIAKVDSMKDPVWAAELADLGEYNENGAGLLGLVRDSNVEGMSKGELAASDANLMARINDGRLLTSLHVSENGNILDIHKNRDVLQAIYRSFSSPRELKSSDGKFNKEFEARVRGSLLAYALGPEHTDLITRLVEDTGGVKNLADGIMYAAPELAKTKAEGGVDIGQDILKPAVETLLAFKADAEKFGNSLQTFLDQNDFLRTNNPAAEKLLLELASRNRSAKKIGEFLAEMAAKESKRAMEDSQYDGALFSRGTGANAEAARLRKLQEKQRSEGLNRYETDELTNLEKRAGQHFMGFFDEAKKSPAFALESQEEKPQKPTSPADQLSLLSRRADDSESKKAAKMLKEKMKPWMASSNQLEGHEINEGGAEGVSSNPDRYAPADSYIRQKVVASSIEKLQQELEKVNPDPSSLLSRRAPKSGGQPDLFDDQLDLFIHAKKETETYEKALETEGITDPHAKQEAAMQDLGLTAPEALKLFPSGEEAAPTTNSSQISSKLVDEAPSPSPKQEAKKGITDFGEKIGGARKDTSIKTGATGVTKSSDERPAWARRYDIAQISKSMDASEEGKWQISDNKQKDWRGQPKDIGRPFNTKEEAEAAIPLLAVSRNHDVRMERVNPLTPEERAANEAARKAAANQLSDIATKVEALKEEHGALLQKAMMSDMYQKAFDKGDIAQDVYDKIKENGGILTPEEQAKAQEVQGQIDQIKNSLGSGLSAKEDAEHKYTIWRKVSDQKRVQVVEQEFPTREDALRYMAEHAQEIIETKTSHREELFATPENAVRTGAPRREGPADAQLFQDAFGFRGVEFGNWMRQEGEKGNERQEVLDHAYDGLHDLAETLGIPAKAISLNGDLALAFGARGQGLQGAKAHYERTYAAINLTKMSGAGSLAHEWYHAFDHYMARLDGKAKGEMVRNEDGNLVFPATSREGDYSSHGFGYKSQVRPEVRAAYEELMKVIKYRAVQFQEDSAKAEQFVKSTRDSLENEIKSLRDSLSRQLDATYYKRNNKPATEAQLAKFDELTLPMINGENLETEHRTVEGKSKWGNYRWTNDSLEALNSLYKEVRGRAGFQKEGGGVLNSLSAYMKRYRERIAMLDSASKQETKTRTVPSNYAMDAKKIDQGAVTDYWTTPHELAARAFSAYVEDRIADTGNKSEFLSYGADNSLPEYRMWNLRPFPEGEERIAINGAFEQLFQTLKAEPTEKGTALLSRSADREEDQNSGVSPSDHYSFKDASGQDPRLDEWIRQISADRKREPFYSGEDPGLRRVSVTANSRDGSGSGLRFLSTFEKLVGKQVVWLAPKKGKKVNFGAFLDPSHPNIIYLNAESRTPLTALVGEEWLHSLKLQDKDEYDRLISKLKPHVLNWEENAAKMKDLGYDDPSKFEEEYVAKIVADAFTRPSFYDHLAKRDHGLFGEIVDHINQWFSDLKNKLINTHWGTENHIKDIDAIHGAIADSLQKAGSNHYSGLVGFDDPRIERSASSGGADQLQLDFDQAREDGAKSPAQRLRESQDIINSVAAKFSDMPNYDADDAKQAARIAIAKAAKAYDPERGVPFRAFATLAAKNALRDLYRVEARHAGRYPTTLDETIGDDPQGTETTWKDQIADENMPLASDQAAMSESQRLLTDSISELPERMQMAVRGMLDGQNGQEIADAMGVSRQAVNNLQKAAMRRLEGNLRSQGITDVGSLLSRSAPREDAEGDDIDQIMRGLNEELDHDVIGGLRDRAISEEGSGEPKQIGRPDLAYGARNPETRAVDQYYTDTAPKETWAQWEDAAQEMLRKDAGGVQASIQRKGLSGESLNSEQTVAAGIIADKLRRKMVEDPTEENKRAFNLFQYAYRTARSQAGRVLAAGRDQFMTPAQRHREFLIDMMTKPSKEAEKAIRTEKDPTRRAALIDEETRRVMEKLKAAGITPMDIMGERVTMRLADKKMISELRSLLSRAASGASEIKRSAFDMLLKNKSLDAISKATGLKTAEIQKIKDDCIAKLRKDHFAKFQAGAKADKATLITGKKVSESAAEAEFQKWINNLGFVSNEKQGKPKFNVEDPAHVMRVAKAIQEARGDAGFMDKAYEAWISGILSGPQTHVANITGNLGSAALNLTLQRGMEAFVNLAIGDKKSASFGEFKWLMKGFMPGIAKGYAMAAKAWSSEHDFFEHTILGTPLELAHFDKAGGHQAAIGGKLGKNVRIPMRALAFADSMFKMALGQMEVGAIAYRMAKAEGLSGQALSDRIETLSKTRGEVVGENLSKVAVTKESVRWFAEILAGRDENLDADELIEDRGSDAWQMAREQAAYDAAKSSGWTQEAWERSVESSREMTFQQDLKSRKDGGNMGEALAGWIQNGRNEHKILAWLFPFVRTPYNIFRVGIRKSPLGAVNLAAQVAKGLYSIKNGKGYIEGHPEAVRDLAEQAIAWGAGALLFGAAQGDDDDDEKMLLITGSHPRSKESTGIRGLNERAFGGEYVIRIGGRNGITIPYGRIEPIATVLGTTIDVIKGIKRNGTTSDNMNALLGYMLDQANGKTFLSGASTISDLVRGKTDPIEAVKKGLLQAIVPNIIRSPLRSIDEYVRDSRHASPVYTMLPASGLAEEQINPYGEPIKKSGNPLTRLFLSTPIASDETLRASDKLLLNWNRANPTEAWAPQSPLATFKDAKGKDVPMTAEETKRFRIAAGRLASAKLRGVVNARNAGNPTMDDLKKVKNAFESANHEAKQRLFSPGYIARRKQGALAGS